MPPAKAVMNFINALSLAPNAKDWLTNSCYPRILHVFDHACNLINEHREVLSVVTPQIGNGPFNLVIENNVLFSGHLSLQSPVSFSTTQLHLGDLTIHIVGAKLWNPRPDWEMLHIRSDDILNHLTQLPTANYQVSNSLVAGLSTALANAHIPSSLTAAQKLAGLGQGLTPSGDDFILGAVLAAWIIHPPEIASVLAREITNVAAPLTTSISAAWLRSAGRGEAGILWHNFFNALVSADPAQIQEAANNILAIGETSGADALAGFIDIFISYAERETKSCHS